MMNSFPRPANFYEIIINKSEVPINKCLVSKYKIEIYECVYKY